MVQNCTKSPEIITSIAQVPVRGAIWNGTGFEWMESDECSSMGGTPPGRYRAIVDRVKGKVHWIMVETNEARMVCQVLRDAGRPLTRRDIARALEPQVIPNLRTIIEKLMQEGKIAGYITATDTQTTVLRYTLTEKAPH